jgi:uncharacterized protein YabN with tetrapyrrole methylase and pyrophosphatase domain
VFDDVQVTGSNEVASRWEVLKQAEKGRESVTDGIAWQLPALTLYAKLLRKATHVDLAQPDGEEAKARALAALAALPVRADAADDAQSTSRVDDEWGDALIGLLNLAQWSGVDLEGVLRARAQDLRAEIRRAESLDLG